MTSVDNQSLYQALTNKIDDQTYRFIQENFPISEVCPTCNGAKSYSLGGISYECKCDEQRLLQRHYFAANIGREYHDICLKDFHGENRDTVIPVIEDYLENFNDNFHYGLGLSFNGPFGTGKTFAMTLVLKELVKQGRSVYFITFDELILKWAKAWQDEESKRVLYNKLKKVDVLGLDELHTDPRNTGGFLSSGLDNVIRHRTSNLLPTLVTTNMTPEQEEKEFGKAFSLLSARNRRLILHGKDERGGKVREKNYELARSHERRPIC